MAEHRTWSKERMAATIQKNGSLADNNPELLQEWDYDKNENTPNDYTPSSNQKAWWVCSNGHSWYAQINTRAKGHGCPYCSGRRPTEDTNLKVVNPTLAAEWHPTKNGDLRPEMISPYSMKKVWWLCDHGHEWQASVSNRTQGRGCAKCSSELKSSFPEQALLFYLGKYYTVESRIKIAGWELDLYLPDYQIGIEYDGVAYHSKDYLIEREARKNKAFSEAGLDLIRIKENYEKECVEDQTVYFVVDHSYKNFPHSIEMLIELLNKKTGETITPLIDIEADRIEIMSQYMMIDRKNNFAERYPELVCFWNYEKNEGLQPENFRYMSNRKIWWRCPTCSGEWEESVINIAKGNRCPYCSGHRVLEGYNDLQTTNPELVLEWDYEKNKGLLPTQFTQGSGYSVWWKCKAGHSWKSRITKRRCCPVCSDRKVKTPDDVGWLSKYERAKLYYEQHGNLTVPAAYNDGDFQLGYWIRTQRAALKNGTLSEERKRLLDEIGMVWSMKPGAKKKQ